MKSLSEIGEEVLAAVKGFPEIPEAVYNLWFTGLEFVYLDEKVAVVACRTCFMRSAFITNGYHKTLQKAFHAVLDKDVDVLLVSPEDSSVEKTVKDYYEKQTQKAEEEKFLASFPERPFINREYTFDTFLVGSSNRLAWSAAKAVAQSADDYAYNLLFIYGASGLGKTHLLYAITDEISKKQPGKKFLYVKCEDFLNQMIESIRRMNTAAFRQKYRMTDVLLIDDIQFLAGKEGTQEEFFNTFNDLYENGKQIIMTSDRPPREIQPLEDRIKTRLEWALLADIIPPDYELRVAILKNKAEKMQIRLSDDVINFLAEHLTDNVRQLEGALRRLSAQAFLTNMPLTLDMAKHCITDVSHGSESTVVTVDRIFDRVSRKYGVTVGELKSKERKRNVAQARHVCIYLIRKMTGMSFPDIGKLFGRDHSTVMASNNFIDSEVKENTILEFQLNDLMKEIRG